MNITKRNGNSEELNLNKIVARIKKQCYSLDTNFVNVDKLAINVIQGLFDGATTRQIDELIAEQAASASTIHFDYSTLAARILVTSLHKDTSKSFSQTVEKLYSENIVSELFYKNVQKHKKELDAVIVYDRDFNFDYFGYRTLEKSYLLKDRSGRIIERPQHLYMRVAVGIWGDNLEEILNTYNILSEKYATHATPTLFNAGTNIPQLSSCFLLKVDDDSLDEIYKILADTAKISKLAGGIGISISKIRAKNSAIKSVNGKSDGIIPMLKVFNETARYVNQASRRKGSFAIYLEPWHDDVFDFIELRKNSGAEELRARDLFLALWVNDMFMDAVNNDGDWWLMCPNESPNLHDVYGQEFETLYKQYVSEGKFRRKIKARDLWMKILENQIETGTPYILYKDSINEKSNQKNIGVISSSNLCSEIVEFTSKDETAICTVSTMGLPKFVENGTFNFQKFYDTTYQMIKNMDRIIDVTLNPIKEGDVSNSRHRPTGLGVQGLADVFAMLEVPFDSEFAKDLNKKIFETLYFAAITSSKDISKKVGQENFKDVTDDPNLIGYLGAYSTFKGSPISQGIFQFDMWEDRKVGTKEGKTEIIERTPIKLSGMWDWETLREDVKKYGVRNSLSLSLPPSASTSQLLGNNECFEPFTSNIYKRNTLSGTFVVTNKFLIKDLIKLGVWDENMKKRIMLADGSVQNIDEIPQKIKDIYKTVWELKMKDIIDMSADRSPFICQTQSLNLFFQNVNFAKLSSALMYGWKKGLKTGSYYIRTKSITEANKALGIDVSTINVPKVVVKEIVEEYSPEDAVTCSLDNPDACMACSG
jgi:ribonucleoside-diphosphate reductase alpha chain